MKPGPAGDNAAEDAEVIRLAKARLIRICRLNGAAAEQALARGAAEQKAALVSVAMRVLAAIPADLAAGKVVPVGRPPDRDRRQPTGPKQHHQHNQPNQHKKPFRRGGGRRHGKR